MLCSYAQQSTMNSVAFGSTAEVHEYRRTSMNDTIRLNNVKDVMDRLRLGKIQGLRRDGQRATALGQVGSRRLIPESAIVDYIQSLIDNTTTNDLRSVPTELPTASVQAQPTPEAAA